MPRVAFGVAVLVSLVVLFLPASGVPTAPPGTDKVVHLVVFAALALSGRWAGLARLPLLLGLVAYAVGSEVLQGATALGRSASVADGLADVAGAVLGLLLWSAFTRRAR
ncbi:VanZ family protein [Blastococcus sp. TF02A_35]|uniref:VanZ family protein n=1 Tax=Blastococcus sp. TF02A-35 TaxID=2559612 RepID=UPI001FD75F20|nr:VanZ family protein [Blastococcus sp. TF02A_35]